jgi:adenylate cyclase
MRMQDLLPVSTTRAAQRNCLAACAISDADGYTGIAEGMEPAHLVELVNSYFRTLFAAVLGNGGVVADVKGDGVLAIWTSEQPDVALRTRVCRSCLRMVEAAERFNRRLPARRLPTRVGADFGPIALANVGAFARFEYRAVGDTVNTCSRLEQLNKQLGTRILVSQALAQGVDAFLFRDLGEFTLRGKRASLRVFELLAERARAAQGQLLLCEGFARARAAYEAGCIDEAIARFGTLCARYPQDGPSRFFLHRCTERADMRSADLGSHCDSALSFAVH